ncbi:MAG: cyclic nucleotide-binding domain-containing protein [Candidatus Marinimicrobia bacterium]|nr:cyclic nucleotide-binding domain-containing protein [Candidatus Neomarinimicrobiota bacterium]MCF7841122.1 cyclic nucleotide-binding domain-containing protein [Candidatus Neomarinimicrobiota bacterium]MCF7901788.1 cyclic nucleotide-binding domain-containing protein [Candidatus Neomarinimicrobiota bacterium]
MSFVEKNALRTYQPDDVICGEGDDGKSMFILQSGEVEVTKVVDNRPVKLATLTAGAIFGEMSMVDGRQRSATITARTTTQCIEINKILFEQRMEEVPSWMQAFYEILVDRLRQADSTQNTLSKADQGKQVVYLLYYLVSHRDPDKFNQFQITWKETAETIAFLTNVSQTFVEKVMNKLTLSRIAKSGINYEAGRQFIVNDIVTFQSLAQYCREQYFSRIGKSISPEFEEQSRQELKLLKFIASLLSEQGSANDLALTYFNDRLQRDLKHSPADFESEIQRLLRTGILTIKLDQQMDKYYDVNRELLEIRLGRGKRLDEFKKITESLG